MPRLLVISGGGRVSRVQLSINVSGFGPAVAFYSRLLGAQPITLRGGMGPRAGTWRRLGHPRSGDVEPFPG